MKVPIIIKDKETSDFVLQYWNRLKTEQKKVSDIEKIIYSPLGINYATIKKIYFVNFLFHSLIIKNKKFYDSYQYVTTDIELQNLITKVLEFELTDEKGELTKEELTGLIKYHKNLKIDI